MTVDGRAGSKLITTSVPILPTAARSLPEKTGTPPCPCGEDRVFCHHALAAWL